MKYKIKQQQKFQPFKIEIELESIKDLEELEMILSLRKPESEYIFLHHYIRNILDNLEE